MVLKHWGRFSDASPPERTQACPPSESGHAYYGCFTQKTGTETVLCDFQGRWYRLCSFFLVRWDTYSWSFGLSVNPRPPSSKEAQATWKDQRPCRLPQGRSRLSSAFGLSQARCHTCEWSLQVSPTPSCLSPGALQIFSEHQTLQRTEKLPSVWCLISRGKES